MNQLGALQGNRAGLTHGDDRGARTQAGDLAQAVGQFVRRRQLVGKALGSDHDIGQGEQFAHAARELAGVEQDGDPFAARLFRDRGLQGGLRSIDAQQPRAVEQSVRQIARGKRRHIAPRKQDFALVTEFVDLDDRDRRDLALFY